MKELSPGDVFIAFDSDMNAFSGNKKGKRKYHLYLGRNEYYIINTDPPPKWKKTGMIGSFFLKEKDCGILKRDCYIDITWPQCRDISTFKIEGKAKLSKESILNLIEHINLSC